MGKRSEQEPEAIRLYAEGKEIPQISVELGVSENSLRLWKKRATSETGSEWDDARAAFRKGTTAAFEDVGKRVARARAVAEKLTGDAKSQGQMGLALNQALQTVVWDFIGQMQTTDVLDSDTMAASIEQCQRLANTLQKLEQAAALNLKREEEIRKQERERAADQAAKIAKKGGLSADRVNEIRNQILGVA